MYTLSLTYPQRKKSHTITSGDLGGHPLLAKPTWKCYRPGCCQDYKLLKVMATFFSRMEHRNTQHWSLNVRAFLNTNLPNRWIGRAGQHDQVFCKWPPRSPDLTVCDFFLWGYVKDKVYIPPLPQTVDELQERITEALRAIPPDMLQKVWTELDYRLDICRATRGAHIECL